MNELLKPVGMIEPGTVTHIEVKHETGCKAIKTQRITDCTCTPVVERLGQC